MLRATLITKIPAERFHSFDGSIPKIGDIVELDQGFTFPDGMPGGLVHCMDQDGKIRCEAEVYDSEIGDVIKT